MERKTTAKLVVLLLFAALVALIARRVLDRAAAVHEVRGPHQRRALRRRQPELWQPCGASLAIVIC